MNYNNLYTQGKDYENSNPWSFNAGNSSNGINTQFHKNHENAYQSVRHFATKDKGKAKANQECKCSRAIESMENEINEATAYSTHLKTQNSTLLSANNKLRESIDNIQPEHERLCERYRKLQKMIYGMESRAIVYSDYIDEMKEALDKG